MQPDHSKTKNLHVTGPTFIRYSFIGFRICRCLFKRLLQQGICRAQWKDRGNLSVVPEELLLLEEEEESESEESDWLEEPEEESDEPEEESEDSTSWFCVMIIFGAFFRCSLSSSLKNNTSVLNPVNASSCLDKSKCHCVLSVRDV